MTRAERDGIRGASGEGLLARMALDVSARPEEVAIARHAVADFLTEHGVPSVVIDDLELVTSELVTNAIIHPWPVPGDGHAVHIEVESSDTIVLVVSNVGSVDAIAPVEQWRPAPPLALSGRGLGIVRRLTDAVTVEQEGDRTVITCQRRLPDGGPSS